MLMDRKRLQPAVRVFQEFCLLYPISTQFVIASPPSNPRFQRSSPSVDAHQLDKVSLLRRTVSSTMLVSREGLLSRWGYELTKDTGIGGRRSGTASL